MGGDGGADEDANIVVVMMGSQVVGRLSVEHCPSVSSPLDACSTPACSGTRSSPARSGGVERRGAKGIFWARLVAAQRRPSVYWEDDHAIALVRALAQELLRGTQNK